jgi:hypothetical protein
MGDAFKRVVSGDTLEIRAAAWNACLDAAEAHREGQTFTPIPGNKQFRQADIVLVKNSSGSAVARFGVLGISGVIFTPSAALASFQNQVAFTGVAPTTADHKGKFLVCLDPIANGKVGRAWIAGVCQVQVDIADASHKFCDVKNSDKTQLKSGGSGSGRILYKPSGTGTKWCVVRFGNDSGGATKVGKTKETWEKDTVATIDLWESGTPPDETHEEGATLDNCVNHFAKVPAERWVIVSQAANGYWYLVEFERLDCEEPLTKAKLVTVTGYDQTVRQVLGHAPGSGAECVALEWMNVIDCDPNAQ